MAVTRSQLVFSCLLLMLTPPVSSFAKARNGVVGGMSGLVVRAFGQNRGDGKNSTVAAGHVAVVSDQMPFGAEVPDTSVRDEFDLPLPQLDNCTQCRGTSDGRDCDHGEWCARCGPSCQWSIFGEWLYLRPRDAGVAYAVPIDGPIAAPPSNNPIQVGPVGVVDPDYDPGFRAGFAVALGQSRSLMAQFSSLDTTAVDGIAVAAPDVIRSLVSHPSSLSAATDFLQASARYDVDFDTLDLDCRRLWRCGCSHELAYFVGARYAKLEQDFQATFVNTGTEIVRTDIGFEGGGIRFGLDGQRHGAARCWYVYGTGAVSFVAGEFRGTYFQGQSFDPTVVDTRWESGRAVAILETELGVGWQSAGGRLRASLGYAFSAWLNAVKTEQFIRAVQDNSFLHLDDTLSFDGLAAGLELHY